ncbi:MAG: hypothetical protein HUJ51_03170 [Eggerthellaceae bacterium]|nr:hypothetical protein [Eggerthellaceae bacterium]
MKDIGFSPGIICFYFDDIRAIKGGSRHEGMFNTGAALATGLTNVCKAG